jgi:SAM-dependent methyltransferase
MNRSGEREAWAGFWKAAPASSGGGCLPHALARIDGLQGGFWSAFASQLPKRAKVLDLATGDGVVLQKMLRVRPDLRLTGVDSSPILPPAPKGVQLKSGMAMEQLSFSDSSFDAVTSQFGFEYGDTAAASQEIARVLKGGGLLAMIVHHRSSPILAHNLLRREALHWAISAGGYLDKARAFMAARAKYRLPTPAFFRGAPGEARRLFPSQSVAVEFVTAILQSLELSESRSVTEAAGVLDVLQEKAMGEIARIDALQRSACGEQELSKLIGQLSDAGLDVLPAQELLDAHSALPIAWTMTGSLPRTRAS